MRGLAGDAANVVRRVMRRGRRVAFYTRREIAAGEELQYDYGPEYWEGREDQLVGSENGRSDDS